MGEMAEFRSVDEADTKQLRSCEAHSTLYLKLNAKVFLMVYFTDNLVNNSRGKVYDFTKDSVAVFFESMNHPNYKQTFIQCIASI